mgnify:CR=1 FL=1
MRTSYVPKNQRSNSDDIPKLDRSRQSAFSPNAEKDLDESEIKENLINAYMDISNELASRNADEDSEYADDLEDEEEYDDSEDDEEDDEDNEFDEVRQEPKKNTGAIIGICVGLAVVVGGGIFLNSYISGLKERQAIEQQEASAKKESESLEDIKTRVSKLYTDSKKSDIKSDVTQDTLDEYYKELSFIKGEGTDSVTKELDTIGQFINDKGILTGYNDDSYNLDTAGLIDNVNSIKNGTENYSVSGLVLTINELASKISSQYDDYKELRSEMEKFKDYINFDEADYKSKIDDITHTPNKDELMKIYDKRVADKKAAQVNKKLQEAADDDARAQAQAELDQAQEQQGKMQNELDALRQKLKEQLNTAPTSEPTPTEEVTQPSDDSDVSEDESDDYEEEVTMPSTDDEETYTVDDSLD